jgi:hypothetical protein
MLSKFCLLGFLFLLCITLLSCSKVSEVPHSTSTPKNTTNVSPTGIQDDNIVAQACQKTVNTISSLPRKYKSIDYSKDAPMSAGMFNVNDYFSILDHLQIESGYTLDYIYHNLGGSGHPFIYARKVNQTPYKAFTEIVKGSENDWLNHVQVDGTKQGFFQFAILRKLGPQFYLYWHSGYDDHTIVCDREGLENVLSRQTFQNISIPQDVQGKARKLDLTPNVNFESGKVIVKIVYFTNWGGFIEETSTISRSFPHQILDTKTQTLVVYNCGVVF